MESAHRQLYRCSTYHEKTWLRKDIKQPVLSFICSLSVIAFCSPLSPPLSITFLSFPYLICFFSHTCYFCDIKSIAVNPNINSETVVPELCFRIRNWRGLSFYGSGGPNGYTGLHGAAFFGIVELVVALFVTRGLDINGMDGMGGTALLWAEIMGMVRAILFTL